MGALPSFPPPLPAQSYLICISKTHVPFLLHTTCAQKAPENCGKRAPEHFEEKKNQTDKQKTSEKTAEKINLIHSRSDELILPLNSSLAQDRQAAPCAFAGEERRADSAVRAKYCVSKRRSPPACPRGWCVGSRGSVAAALPFPALRKSSERGTAC